MSKIKSLILGSAAGLFAVAGAQAADLPVKAKAVQYVKICSLYGAGFYYIPGTDTCIKIGGHIRLDLGFNVATTFDTPAWQGGNTGLQTRGRDYYQSRMRIGMNTDTRTATEYGVLRTYWDVKFEFNDARENLAGGYIEVDYGFIQFAGFTFGKAVSNFDAPWILSMPTINSFVIGGSDNKTGITQIAYTAQFGNGVSASLGLEDARPYRKAGILDATGTQLAAAATPAYGTTPSSILGNVEGGNWMPDVVGNVRFEQGWGSFHLAGAIHHVNATYYSGGTMSTAASAAEKWGNPDSKIGYAIGGALEFKNLPTGVGDSLKIDATYAHGAARYVFGGTFDAVASGRVGSIDGHNLAMGGAVDGVFASNIGAAGGTSIALSTSYGVRAFYEHYWTPQLRSSVWGGFAWQRYNGDSGPLMLAVINNSVNGRNFCAGAHAANGAIPAVGCLGGNANLMISQVGTTTSWQPVKDLTFSGEFTWAHVDTSLTSAGPGSVPGNARAGLYNQGDINLYSGGLRVLRSF
jgi:hypothetical protein